MTTPIEDYALIGDCETAALVSKQGSIDWLCWPRFDSDASFSALLGTPENGRWLVQPDEIKKITRSYRPGTLILDTKFTTPTGLVVVTDFMPPRGRSSDLIRIVTCEQGQVSMRFELVIRFGYGRIVPWVTRESPEIWRAVAGPDMLVLHAPIPLHGEDMRTVGDFTLKAGERVAFSLTYCQSHLPTPTLPDFDASLHDTADFWQEWIGRMECPDSYGEQVTRSLITLRALIYRPTGGIVAAPTTSLPEHLGGVRNWDYRYCWLRDATMTLLAFMNAGYYEEALAWRDWLLRAIAGSPEQLQIMYGVAGERRLTEWEVDWLPGYASSAPIRIGNEASSQIQLDVIGEVLDALHQGRRGTVDRVGRAWDLQRELLDFLEGMWNKPDYGIWEVRGPPQHFTYSKAMCWVAFDRSIKDAETCGFDGPVDRWRAIRDEIHKEICERGFDVELGSFVQSYGSKQLDASLLLLPQLGFLPPDDPRIVGTVAQIERTLLRDGLVLRYHTSETDDGLPTGEGAFLACSFWLADAYALTGRIEDAKNLFERLVALCNDVGLLAEEYDPKQKRMLGNFPQAFSHLALVNTAFNLASYAKPAEQRAEKKQRVGDEVMER